MAAVKKQSYAGKGGYRPITVIWGWCKSGPFYAAKS
jgi:hypothetical protein